MSPTPKRHQKSAALRVRLSGHAMAALKRKARQQGCSVSDFVRALLGQQLTGDKPTESYASQRLILAAPELLEFAKRVLAADGAPQRWGRPGSLLDAAKALIDRIEEGPSDP